MQSNIIKTKKKGKKEKGNKKEYLKAKAPRLDF